MSQTFSRDDMPMLQFTIGEAVQQRRLDGGIESGATAK